MTHRKKIGEQLSCYRNKQGLTIRELADKCGVNFSNIGKIERGEYNVSIDILSKVCNALDAHIEIVENKNK